MRNIDGKHIVYAAKMRDGGYRVVEAVDWADCKRHLGNAALSIKERLVDLPKLHEIQHDEDARRALYEART